MDVTPKLEDTPEYVALKNSQTMLVFTCKHGFEFKVSPMWSLNITEAQHNICGCSIRAEDKFIRG